MKIIECAAPPYDHERLSGTLSDGRKFVVTFRMDRTAVVPDEVAEFLTPIARGVVILRDAEVEGEKSDCTFVEDSLAAIRMQRRHSPFPEEMNILTMPELRPSYLKGEAEELVSPKTSGKNRKRV